MQKLAIIVLPYLLLVCLNLYYEINIVHNADMAGWWQLSLLIHCIFIGLVALLYCWLDSKRLDSSGQDKNVKSATNSNLDWTWLFSLLLILPLIISWAINYFYPINWLAVNEGRMSLTPLQKFATNAWFSGIWVALLLLLHGIKNRHNRHKLPSKL